ncbi:hypothetical protein J6590_102593 [Homalodisca vitripennis]|nr:hypothetical protein J6590_102593 [Homalodisca vitripennis]
MDELCLKHHMMFIAEISGLTDVPERSGQLVPQTPYSLGSLLTGISSYRPEHYSGWRNGRYGFHGLSQTLSVAASPLTRGAKHWAARIARLQRPYGPTSD